MKNSNYNKRKTQILSILNNSSYLYTSKEIADLTPVSLSCINALLKRYVGQGLLKRKKVESRYFYWITKKGIDRLEYLLEKETEKEEIEKTEPRIELLERELVVKKTPIKLMEREPVRFKNE